MSEPTDAVSRNTIGLTQGGRDALDAIMEKGWFSGRDAAFKAGVAYAINLDLKPTEGSFNTIWNVGTLDRSGDFLSIVSVFAEHPRPWDLVQGLGDAGLRAMAARASLADVPSEVLLTQA
jgi:hypothetical protein